MADAGRQSFTDKVSDEQSESPRRPSIIAHVTTEEATTCEPADKSAKVKDTVTPDSQKSTLDQAGDKIKGKTDDAAGSVQPDSEKSTTQKIGDSTSDTLKSASEQVGHERLKTI